MTFYLHFTPYSRWLKLIWQAVYVNFTNFNFSCLNGRLIYSRHYKVHCHVTIMSKSGRRIVNFFSSFTIHLLLMNEQHTVFWNFQLITVEFTSFHVEKKRNYGYNMEEKKTKLQVQNEKIESSCQRLILSCKLATQTMSIHTNFSNQKIWYTV